MVNTATCSTLTYFAAMLAYPNVSPSAPASACVALLDPDIPAAALVGRFASYAAETLLPQIEEDYTSAFDLDPKCALYVGYHLFGESYKRSVFLLGLNERFGAQRFTPDGELPDHLTVILRCLASAIDDEQAQELIVDAVLPALDRMTGRTKAVDDADTTTADQLSDKEMVHRTPFFDLLEALRLVLHGIVIDLNSRSAATPVGATSGLSDFHGGLRDG